MTAIHFFINGSFRLSERECFVRCAVGSLRSLDSLFTRDRALMIQIRGICPTPNDWGDTELKSIHCLNAVSPLSIAAVAQFESLKQRRSKHSTRIHCGTQLCLRFRFTLPCCVEYLFRSEILFRSPTARRRPVTAPT